jgi:uncharacterized protein
LFGEVANHEGIGPSDDVFEPYLSMAAARDIPVSIHMGGRPPGTPYLGSPRYRAAL